MDNFDYDGDGTPARCTCTECTTLGQYANKNKSDCIYFVRSISN